MAQTCLPPGFRFHPTDVELVSYYLKRKIMGKKLLVEAISDVELYKFAPWDLPDKSCLRSKDLEWFFFCPHDKKYPNGCRKNRGTPNGYWKTSGKDRTIKLNSHIVGSKKTLIFHEGKAPKGNRTDWVMYEYRMEDDDLVSAGFSKDAYVLCKIFKKSGLGPRIGEQYGAPFNEDEWENADAETSMFPLMSSSELANSAEGPHVQHAGTARAVEQPPVHHSSAACAQKESSSEHVTAATSVEDLGYVTADCTLQELPCQQSVKSSGDGVVSGNNRSNEVNNMYNPPEIDGFLLEELSRFLHDSPHRDSCVGEHSGLPPMSEAEAQALEENTCDLYNELAGLAGLGGVPNVDGFGASDVDVTDHTFHPTYSELANGDDYIELNYLLSYELPVPSNQFWQYPLDHSTYDGHYHDGSTLSAAFAASDSLPTMPGIVDDPPTVANNNGFATDFLDTNYPDPTMQYPFS